MPELELHTLNNQATATPHALIAKSEIAYTAAMRYIALQCIAQGDRIILLAGPSGSGKTTTASLLKRELSSRGYPTQVVSLDDFYRSPDDPDYPRLPDGRQDYECVESLQIPRIRETLAAIQEGRDIMLPRFDFKRCCSIPEATLLRHEPNGIVIFEGLHALNPVLTEGLPASGVYRLFISVSTNINVDGVRILSGRKLRFVRRLVRDSIYRASDAKKTLSLWPHVLHGEDVYLYPYRNTADFCLNTFHAFELGVLRDRALALLSAPDVEGEYAQIVIGALRAAEPICSALVPPESLIREFIGPETVCESDPT